MSAPQISGAGTQIMKLLDSTSNGCYGTVSNGGFSSWDPTLGTGAFGSTGCISFINPGSTVYIASPNSSAAVNPSNLNVVTEELWFKSASGSTGLLFGMGDANNDNSGNYDHQLYLDSSGKLNFNVYNSSMCTVTSTSKYNDNNWHFAVATMSSAGMVLYVDGKAVGVNTNTGESKSYSAYWHIAADQGPGGLYRSGSLEEVRVLNTASSSGWIATEYNNQNNPGGYVSFGSEQTLTAVESLNASAASLPLAVTKLQGAAKFNALGKDHCVISGTIPELPSSFKLAGQPLVLSVGGANAAFTLNAKGTAKSAGGSVALKFRSGNATFSAKLQGGLASAWNFNASANGNSTRTMTVSVQTNNAIYSAPVTVKLSSKAHKEAEFTK